MGAARMIEGVAAGQRARRMAAAAAVLLAAFPSAAHAQPEDTVRVEWAASANRSLVILNAYAVRGGNPDLASIRGLLIERDPAALPDAANHRHPFVNRASAYADAVGSPFLRALGLSDITLDTLANGSAGSSVKNQFDVQEWTGLLNRLLGKEDIEIVEGTHRLIVRQVAEPVASLIAPDLDTQFGSREPDPVLPHLKSGLIALSDGRGGGARTDAIDFGSIALQERTVIQRYLKNYGVGQVKTELSFRNMALGTGFSAGGVQTLAVPPGDSVPVSFAFVPRDAGPQRDTLDFLVNGEPRVQVIVTGEGVSLGIVARAWNWIAARAELLVGLLAFTLAVLIGRKRGVTLDLPWRREPTTGRPEPSRATPGPAWDGGPTIPTFAPPKTGPQPHDPFTPGAGRSGDEIVRQRLATARQAIQEALAELGEDPLPDDAGHGPGESRAAENLRRLRELERERNRLVEARATLEGRVETITAERDGLAGQVRARDDALRAQQAAAEDAAAGLRQEVNRLSDEREKLVTRLRAVAEVLELTDEMVSDAGWPETQRRLPELRDGGKPRYLRNFEQLVADLTAIFEEIERRAGEGRLAAAVSAVLGGSNNNAGLRTVAAELDRKSLAMRLGLAHPRELRTLGAGRFYREFVDRRFRPIIDNIAKLGLYARSRSPEFGMGQRLTREGVDPALLERALALIETRMRVDFDVEVHTVRLFEERFDPARHDIANHSTLRHTLPDLDSSIRRLPPETIYDITSVGLRSAGLGLSVRPVVASVTSQ